MLKRLIGFVLLLVVALSIAATAQVRQPKSVRDYFLLLPEEYFSLDCCMHLPEAERKRTYLKRYLNVEDTKNAYISGYGDAAQEGFAMTLFKKPNGKYLIGLYTYGEGGVEDTPWTVFLTYEGGIWSDVSSTVVEGYSKERFIYEMPRFGTTVEVFEKQEDSDEGWYKGKKLHDLVWKNGRFTPKKS